MKNMSARILLLFAFIGLVFTYPDCSEHSHHKHHHHHHHHHGHRSTTTPEPKPECRTDSKIVLSNISSRKYKIDLYIQNGLVGSLFDLTLAKGKCVLRMQANGENSPYLELIKKSIPVKTLPLPEVSSTFSIVFGKGEFSMSSADFRQEYDIESLLRQCGMNTSHGIIGNIIGSLVSIVFKTLETLFGSPFLTISSSFAQSAGICILDVQRI